MGALRIYVAGPLSAATPDGRVANVRRALEVGTVLARRGHWPYVPHLSHYWDPDDSLFGWDWWLAYDRQWVAACDALFYIAPSRGADLELDWARTAGKMIFTELAGVPDGRVRIWP